MKHFLEEEKYKKIRIRNISLDIFPLVKSKVKLKNVF